MGQGQDLGEFELIDYFFQRDLSPAQRDSHQGKILAGIGDDCAELEVASGRQLVFSIDTLVEAVHFPMDMDPEALGWRCLAVNLSDLAAAGAEPWCFTLALTLPKAEFSWLKGFSRGLFALADRYGMALVGGDTTRGPRAISIQVQGTRSGGSLSRGGAQAGDLLLVSGTLGDAAAALRFLDLPSAAYNSSQQYLRQRYERPEPRLAIGQRLLGLATAAIDVSDGLLADVGHLCSRSGVGAVIDSHRIPLSTAILAELPKDDALHCALEGGDDYELCFTLPPQQLRHIQSWLEEGLVTVIGEIRSESGLLLRDAAGLLSPTSARGYKHFDV